MEGLGLAFLVNLGFRVEGPGFRVESLGLGFLVNLGFRVEGSGFRV